MSNDEHTEQERHHYGMEAIYRDAGLISKWFDETAELIEENVHPEGRADMICITAMTVGANYSNAIVELLKMGYHMPVKALLRILCELSAKLAWCLVTPKRKKSKQHADIEKKISQWEKYTLYKKIRIMQEFREIVPKNQRKDLEFAIDRKRKKMNSLPGTRMPKTIEIFNRLSRNWRTGIYPRGFLQFNDAVHIDLSSLAARININGSEIIVDFDSAEDVKELSGYCLSFMYQIIYLIRYHFGWDTAEMEAEFHQSAHNGNDLDKEDKE